MVTFVCPTNVLGQEYNDSIDSIVSFKVKENIIANVPSIKLKTIIKNQFAAMSGDQITLNDIDSVKYLGTYKLKNVGYVLIFKIQLDHLPMVWHYSWVLLIDKVNHNGYLVELDVIEPIKIKQNSNEFYFAGRYKNRYQYGTFKIFNINNGTMYTVFESDEAVSNYSYDCISYEHDDLKLHNLDVNRDYYLDLKFMGIKNYYCEGHESYGRDERKPIKSDSISIIYCFEGNNKLLRWGRCCQIGENEIVTQN
ncbi:MAG: hypothetical protein LBU51_11215 [Bacteroidales bacterium]|nr:hypothetical protein [Bacteroidales bacterium]